MASNKDGPAVSNVNEVDSSSPSVAQHGTDSKEPQQPNRRQRLVFTDPIAFRYLRDDSCTRVIKTHVALEGFELYLVEQWACSRAHPTFIINTFTGQPQHKVVADILSVPVDEEEWSPRLRMYLKAVSTFHARRKDTPLGGIMVTNLSSFPSALTVIQIPNGDLKEHREMFVVNEDLKRLGCSGRAGLSLTPPTGATIAKFLQLYQTNNAVPIPVAVIEIVKLCQVALVMFDQLAPEYADGLLCDVTERAINEWWVKIGTDFYSVEPTDGILGPTTVSAMLGLYIGARNRLHAFGATTTKDAFDIRGMKRAIGYFQRTARLSNAIPRRLDLMTLQRLHRSTSKAAHNERWAVPRAVKSTVAEYGGKGGEMVMGMVGRDKTGIAEIETLDMKIFSQKATGELSRWLWQGKSKKGPPLDLFGALAADEEGVFSGDEKPANLAPFKKREPHDNKSSTMTSSDVMYMNPLLGSQSSLDVSDKDPALRRTVLKNVTGKMSDARTGLGRFRDAVGRSSIRGHHSKPSCESNTFPIHESMADRARAESKERSRISFEKPEGNVRTGRTAIPLISSEEPRVVSLSSRELTTEKGYISAQDARSPLSEPEQPLSSGSSLMLSRPTSREKLMISAQSPAKESSPKQGKDLVPELHSTRSEDGLADHRDPIASLRAAPSLPRQASMGGVEAVSTWLQAIEQGQKASTTAGDPSAAMADEQQEAIKSQKALTELHRISTKQKPVMDARLRDLEDLELRLRHEYDKLSQAYAERVRDYHSLKEGTTELLSEEEAFLAETFKELEILGAKLEYEMGSLVSKVEDVEDGVADFERQVQDLEARLDGLQEEEPKKDGWRKKLLGRWSVRI